MGNFTLSEIIWILVVILVIFGPQRLPEIARKAGQLAAKARQAAQAVRDEFTSEYGDTIAPLRDVSDELKAARRELRDTAASVLREIEPPGLPGAPKRPKPSDTAPRPPVEEAPTGGPPPDATDTTDSSVDRSGGDADAKDSA